MDYYVKNITENKGKPRIYLDGLQASRAGFSPGDKYEVKIEDGRSITLTVSQDGSRTVSGRLDKKTGEKTTPVIDLNSDVVLGMFDGMDSVRMIVKRGAIIFLPLASEMAKKERLDRLAMKIESGEPIQVGSLTHGVGILANALHNGLIKVGLNANIAFVNEIREDLLDHARVHNDAWNDKTIGIAAPMQEMVQDVWLMDRLPKLEFLDMSLPCSGASRAGSSKLKLEKMEDHPHVGHLVYSALVIISKTQPAVLLLENVEPYAKTASAEILRKQLGDMGYIIHEAVVNGKDFGCLEHRVRWCLVATTQGLDFSFDKIIPSVTIVRKVGDILEDIALDDSRWSKNEGLKAKEVRDIADGKGFRLPLVNEYSEKVPTLRKHYQKKGSCDVQVSHPTDPELSRLFTGNEHLRLKGINPALFGDVSDAMKHQGAGQAVQPPVFEPIGERIGIAMLAAERYSRAKRVIAIEQVSETLKDGIAYDPVVAMSNVMTNVKKDLFGDVNEPDPISQDAQTTKRKSMKRSGGGVG
jgi:DNA (cytosine-5)-methyltransferase 1